MPQNVLFFDLFFTLITPAYTGGINENDILGISVEEWEQIAEDQGLYHRRATGIVKEPKEMIDEILLKGGFTASSHERNQILTLRSARMRHALWNVDPIILHTLECLKERGFPLCLISNADRIDTLYWTASPLYPLFDAALFSCDVGYVKPDPMIYELALAKMHVAPSNAVFIGDGGSNELLGAKKCGMRTVLTEHFITYEDAKRKELHVNADDHISNFCMLLQLF